MTPGCCVAYCRNPVILDLGKYIRVVGFSGQVRYLCQVHGAKSGMLPEQKAAILAIRQARKLAGKKATDP